MTPTAELSPTAQRDEHAGGIPPNHHADHPGFSGLSGAVAAAGFSVGRTADADLAIELTGTGTGDRVVDIGCGPGTAVRRAAAAGAETVIGVDPAAVMLRTARLLALGSWRRRSPVCFRAGTAEALPVPDASASVIWSLATVHHWADLGAGLAEVVRALRPAGRFLALERHVDPGGIGLASHGWTDAQADDFAGRCRQLGLVAEVGRHRAGHKDLISVLCCSA